MSNLVIGNFPYNVPAEEINVIEPLPADEANRRLEAASLRLNAFWHHFYEDACVTPACMRDTLDELLLIIDDGEIPEALNDAGGVVTDDGSVDVVDTDGGDEGGDGN